MTNNYIFYTSELTTILDSLINYFPYRLAFKLYDIQQKEKLTYDNLFADGFTNNENVYNDLTKYLVYNDFAISSADSYIILTDKGRLLIKSGSYKNFVDFEELEQQAKINDLKAKKYYKLIEFLKMFISFALGILSTLITYKLTKC
jgi:hypothetical protein